MTTRDKAPASRRQIGGPGTTPARKPQQQATPSAGPLEPLIEPKTKLTDVAYEKLEEAIVTLRLPPGSVVSEQMLADSIGIGRTPIREAIQRLARERLITVLPQRGLLVADIDIHKQLKLLEARREIERLICRGAALRAGDAERKTFAKLADSFARAASKRDHVAFIRADREFNEICLLAARNEFAEGAMRLLHGLSRRFWYLHFKQQGNMADMARLHAAIALAISNADVEAAAQSLDRLIDHIETYTRAMVLPVR